MNNENLRVVADGDDNNDQCQTYAWCTQPDGHNPDDHMSAQKRVSATGEPRRFAADPDSGGVLVPSVSTFLCMVSEYAMPGVNVTLYDPKTDREVDALLTLDEARVLWGNVGELLEEVRS